MLQGTSQDQIPQIPSSSEHNADTTAIPVQAVDADQLPREKGWTYEEMSSIVGSLYLDSAHQLKVREEQFNAVIEEYDKRIMQLQAELQLRREEMENLRKQVGNLTRELETRNGDQSSTRGNSTSGNGRGDSMSRG